MILCDFEVWVGFMLVCFTVGCFSLGLFVAVGLMLVSVCFCFWVCVYVVPVVVRCLARSASCGFGFRLVRFCLLVRF